MKIKKNIIHYLIPLLFFIVCYYYVWGLPYVPIEKYNTLNFKFYADINKSNCYEIIDFINPIYLKDLDSILVFEKLSPKYLGKYFIFQKIIHLYIGCDKSTLVHELAHHCQIKMYNDTYNQAAQHKGNFDRCEKEIWSSLKQ